MPGVPVGCSLVYRAAKRACDIAFSLTSLVVLSPVFLVTGALVKLGDGGPILQRQKRMGRFGAPFNFYKFRCTRRGAEAAGGEPETTKLGRILRKYSIDELPQLFAVLRGHMSVIGPRPHLDREVAVYSPEQRRRLLVKPGLVCIREVSGRVPMSFDEWIRVDLEYVDRRSLLLDAKIFLRSIPIVLRGEDASK